LCVNSSEPTRLCVLSKNDSSQALVANVKSTNYEVDALAIMAVSSNASHLLEAKDLPLATATRYVSVFLTFNYVKHVILLGCCSQAHYQQTDLLSVAVKWQF